MCCLIFTCDVMIMMCVIFYTVAWITMAINIVRGIGDDRMGEELKSVGVRMLFEKSQWYLLFL